MEGCKQPPQSMELQKRKNKWENCLEFRRNPKKKVLINSRLQSYLDHTVLRKRENAIGP